MRVYAIQPDIVWENPSQTFQHLRQLLADVPPTPGSLVVLPEMFSTGFSMNVDAIAQKQDRPAELFLREMAMTYQCVFLGGVANQLPSSRGVNQALAYDASGQEIVRYSKIHPFSYGSESQHYDGGSQVMAFAHQDWTVAPLVCYDLRFPELFRMAAGKGAQLLVVIANWPASRIDHWTALLRARAIENQAYVIGANRTGNDPLLAYNGQSVIFDPKGHPLATADDRPQIIQADLGLDLLQAYREKFPALRDMKYHWRDDGFASASTARQANA